ncbi:MAG: molybdopterin oxidoreductase family protein, partial [Nocardiopsaceae bacterium]|nr:molybdopterin oxidoreductase family protein [Nocardiopsaceae bacterium]
MTDTHCPYCALQCAMTVTPAAGAAGPPAVRPRDFPVNRGGLCQKGWTSAELLFSSERTLAPRIASADSSWHQALDHVTARITEITDRHGPDAVAVFGSGALTNEKAYLLGKFARVALGTSQIDYNGRFCMSSAAAAGNRAFGLDRGLPFPVTDLGGADLIVLAGANPAETMPPLMSHLTGSSATASSSAPAPASSSSSVPASLSVPAPRGDNSNKSGASRAAGPRLIVIDPRRTPTAETALKNGGLHLQPAPGTDLALALGLLHVAWTAGYLDTPERLAYRQDRTSGWEEVRARLAHWWPERAERLTGVPAADLRRAAHLLHTASRAYILTGRGAEQHSKGTDTVTAWINLALAFGLPGTPGSGYGCLTGQGNGQGGREHGQKADQLPGYRMITDPAARAHVAAVWGIDPAELPGPGRSAVEMFDALGTEIKALLVFGANPVISAPRSLDLTARLRDLDLLVVADFFPSETARLADVVLPTAMWAEESGTTTSLEGRILRRRRALDPPPGVRTDLEIIAALAARLGRAPAEFPSDPDQVLAELGRASAGGRSDYSAVTPQRLDDESRPLHWGGPRMFLDRFAHPDGQARFTPVDHRGAAELPDQDYPLFATTGRILQHYQTGAQTRRVAELAAAAPEAFVEVHPDTARRAGLADGKLARVCSRRGTVTATVRCVPALRYDTVFLPFHFPGDGTANILTNPALDPLSRMPEFKLSA